MAFDSDIVDIKLSEPQFKLVTTESPFPAFVGGFGSGKTEALVQRGLMLKSIYPSLNIAYYLPTFDLVSLIAIPRFEEKLEELKDKGSSIAYKTVKAPRPQINIENGGSIIFRTMDNPNRIVGYEVADSLIDEIDILKEIDAENAWRKILARNRQKKPDGARNTIAVGTTPEGFKFTYNTWGKDNKPGYELIEASTYSNQRNLPVNYIEELMSAYPSNLILAYLMGKFVNLASGSVYPEFDRVLNGSDEVVGTYVHSNGQTLGEDLFIGLDFNVMNMAAIINVRREGFPHAVNEITKVFDTPAMIKAIKNKYPNNKIYVYPDASGGSRKSVDASKSDISLLKQAGFTVMAKEANPPVRDRVLAMNVMILNAKGERRLKVNIKKCPALTEALEKQAYDIKGEPDKSSGLDHPLDAQGYFINYTFPVLGKPISRLTMVGI